MDSVLIRDATAFLRATYVTICKTYLLSNIDGQGSGIKRLIRTP
jgi:hypothetical protein